MTSILRNFLALALALALALIPLALLSIASAPLGAADAKTPTISGVIDKLDSDNSKIIIKTIDANPSKVKTMVVNVDKTSTVTIDKAAAAYADLKEGDKVVVKYSQGVAITVVVTRATSAAKAAKP